MHYPNHPDAAGRARDSVLTQRFRASQECLSRPTAEGAALGAGVALSPGSDTEHRGGLPPRNTANYSNPPNPSHLAPNVNPREKPQIL